MEPFNSESKGNIVQQQHCFPFLVQLCSQSYVCDWSDTPNSLLEKVVGDDRNALFGSLMLMLFYVCVAKCASHIYILFD